MQIAAFYTYVHHRADDGQVFYVGKGKGARAQSSKGRNPFWHRTAKKHGIRVEIAAPWSTEAEAFEHEKFLIACFRDMGHPLSNLTDGGEGVSGLKFSDEARARMVQRQTGKTVSAEVRAKMSATHKAMGPHPNSIAALRGRPVSSETRARMSAAHRGRTVPKERREQISATLTGRPLSEERKAVLKAAMNRPEVKAKQTAARKGKPWSAARRAAYLNRGLS